MVEALAACGANVIAISRDRANLSSAEHAAAAVIASNATDATLMNKVVREEGRVGLHFWYSLLLRDQWL
jgi:NAD(P)-dependent dehydrogenase (short-subunit alcohol dehydrogenase family)